MNKQMGESRTDSQKKKIKKLIRSPEKVVITGNTEKVIEAKPSIPGKSIPDITTYPKLVIDSSGLYYQGQTINNTPEGQGTLCQPNSAIVYKGSWKDGARNGMGTYNYPDGSQYQGNWVENLKHGFGVYLSAQGDKYEGEWRQNLRHGKGKMELASRTTLDGDWFNDEFVSGRVVYSDGSSYQGNLQNWNRNGPGSYAYTNGSIFTGSWENNTKNGEGECMFGNGDQMKGTFKNNKKQGSDFSYYWKSGNTRLQGGSFSDDKYQGGNIIKN